MTQTLQVSPIISRLCKNKTMYLRRNPDGEHEKRYKVRCWEMWLRPYYRDKEPRFVGLVWSEEIVYPVTEE